MTLPQIDGYPPQLEQRGGSPDLVVAEYLHVVKDAITNHPRSLQKKIGPSELGHPCVRRIGYKLLGAPDLNPVQDTPWLPTVGTGVHGWLEDTFTSANTDKDDARWLTELRVSVGQVGGVDVTGSMDLYDRCTATVIDHKIVGPSTLKKYKRSGPGDQYRSQIHLYGRGARLRGLPVDTVMIAFLPRNDELRNAYFWHEPYDEQVALAALQRANGIAATTAALGVQALPVLPTADAYCYRCPFYKAGSTDLTQGCPGDPAAADTTAAAPALTFGGPR